MRSLRRCTRSAWILSASARTEITRIPAHPFYIGTIYHPEFLSRPNKAHPLFAAFIGAAAAHQA